MFFVSCAPYSGAVQTDHARTFGCERRWVQVRRTSDLGYHATGCGFASEWSCDAQTDRCTMTDQRAYGVDSP
jgi:hypothetical protein